MPVNRPRHGEKIERAVWLDEAVKLSIAGHSLRDIGKRVGRHHSTVASALAQEYEDLRPSEEEIRLDRQLKKERLYRLLQKWSELAASDETAAAITIKLEDQIARLEGTDAPKRTELTGANGSALIPTKADLTAIQNEELEALARGDSADGASQGGDGETPPGGSDSDVGDGGLAE